MELFSAAMGSGGDEGDGGEGNEEEFMPADRSAVQSVVFPELRFLGSLLVSDSGIPRDDLIKQISEAASGTVEEDSPDKHPATLQGVDTWTLHQMARSIGVRPAVWHRGGGTSITLRVMQIGWTAFALLLIKGGIAADLAKSGLNEPNGLMYAKSGLACLGALAFLTMFGSARASLRPAGVLAQLGAGVETISETDARSLQRWRCALWTITILLSAFFMIWGAAMVAAAGNDPAAVALGSLYIIAVPPFCIVLFPGWWLSMRFGSCLCRDKANGVIIATNVTDPTKKPSESVDSDSLNNEMDPAQWEAWDQNVVSPALGLDNAFALLARGWGLGLEGLTAGLWLNALSLFTVALNVPYCTAVDETMNYPSGTNRSLALLFTAIFALLPLGLLEDVAETSSRCDALMDALNRACIKHRPEHALAHIDSDGLLWLKNVLKDLHRGQGLGLFIAGKIIDRVALKRLFSALAGGLTTVFSFLLSIEIEPPALAASAAICGLSAPQEAAINELISTMLMGGNTTTCSYNITLAGSIGGGH